MTYKHAWQRPLTATLLLFALALTAFAIQQNVYDKFRNKTHSNKGYLSEEEEIKLGGQVHQQLLNPPQQEGQQQQAKPIRLVQGPLADYIDRLGQRLARDSKRPNLPWRFSVVDDNNLNAFATLGGYVYVHTGLINQVRSEAQLASVIGHEIGHVVGRHGLENVKRAGSLKTQGTVIGAIVLGAILGGQQGAEVGQALGSLVAGGFLMKHGREAEREADYLGLYNLERSGYNTGGMVEMFNLLAEMNKNNPNLFGDILASHPKPTERAENTRREIAEKLRGSDQRGLQTSNDFQRIKGQAGQAPSSNRNVRPRGTGTGTTTTTTTTRKRPRP